MYLSSNLKSIDIIDSLQLMTFLLRSVLAWHAANRHPFQDECWRCYALFATWLKRWKKKDD